MVENNLPIVRKLRQDKNFRTAASNIISVGRSDAESAKDLKLYFSNDLEIHMFFTLQFVLFFCFFL